MNNRTSIPLFTHYPSLMQKIAHKDFGDLPTPVHRLARMGTMLGLENLYVKRDDLSGVMQSDGHRLYGGNKVRKLEFLVADALQKKADTLVTFGGVGSNHALATSVYAQQAGLKAIVILEPQPNSRLVQHNLLLQAYYNTELYEYPLLDVVNDTERLKEILSHITDLEAHAYIIPIGGASPVGSLGFVNAAFELKEQIEQGLLPEPDYIYIALGSRGSASGLRLGLRAAGLKTRVIPVRVTTPLLFNEQSTRALMCESNALLHASDESFPLFDFSDEAGSINHAFDGLEYGIFTPDTVAAITLMREHEGIVLDGVYTGKACAVLMHDAPRIPKNSVVLFWHTYCSDPFDHLLSAVDYKKLPANFHTYFESNVQPLDVF